MGTLLYFIISAVLFFVMMRFCCGPHIMGHGDHVDHGATGKTRSESSDVAIDPVCRMSVRTDTAKSTIYRGAPYYFCSSEHRDAFEADPERYIDSMNTNDTKPTERAS